jgi:urease beta subunit
MIPGEYILAAEDIVANAGRETAHLRVVNTGDRPIQVGSHFHLFEANRALAFDRATAFGMRLNIPAGTAVRFEPGDDKVVTVVRFGGRAIVHGFNNLTNGETTEAQRPAALAEARRRGFKMSQP